MFCQVFISVATKRTFADIKSLNYSTSPDEGFFFFFFYFLEMTQIDVWYREISRAFDLEISVIDEGTRLILHKTRIV